MAMLSGLIKMTEETQTLAITQIRRDGGTQPRQGMNEDVVVDYVAALADGVQFPPIDVMFDGTDYWLYDGFHRIESHLRSGRTEIAARVVPGTLEEAQWRSYAANQSHGLRRSTADKERAIRSALKHAAAPGLSDRQIAKHLGVDNKTIAKYRAELESTEEIPQLTTRTGADGRTRDVSNIAAAKLERGLSTRFNRLVQQHSWGFLFSGADSAEVKAVHNVLTLGEYIPFATREEALEFAESEQRKSEDFLRFTSLSKKPVEATAPQLRPLTMDETMSLVWKVVKMANQLSAASQSVRWRNYLDWIQKHDEPRFFKGHLPEGTSLDGQILINACTSIKMELEKNLEHERKHQAAEQVHGKIPDQLLADQVMVNAEVEKIKASRPLPIFDLPPDIAEWNCKITSNVEWYFPTFYFEDGGGHESTTCADWGAAINWLRDRIKRRQDYLAKRQAQGAVGEPVEPTVPQPQLTAKGVYLSIEEAIINLDVVDLMLSEGGGLLAGKRDILIKLYEMTLATFDGEYGNITNHTPDPVAKAGLMAMIRYLKLTTISYPGES